MEKLTEKELATLHELQAKAKRIKRAEEEFFKEADARREELLIRWGLLRKAEPLRQEDFPDVVIEAGEISDNV